MAAVIAEVRAARPYGVAGWGPGVIRWVMVSLLVTRVKAGERALTRVTSKQRPATIG